MRPLVPPQTKAGTQISLKIRHFLDACQHRLIHLLLVLNALRVDILLGGRLSAIVEKGIFIARLLLARPVGVFAHTGNDIGVDGRDINDSRGGNDVAVVDAAQGHAVGLEGARDEENALVELAQKHDALAAEAAREKDEDCAEMSEKRSE